MPDCKFFTANVSAIQEKVMYHLGQYAAMSILQGGNGFSFFAEPVYKYFTAGKRTGIDILNDQIPDHTLRFVIEKIETDDDLRVALYIDEATRLQTYCLKQAIGNLFATYQLRSALIDNHCMFKVKSSMDQFIEGLQELQIIDLIKQYPEKMKSLFVATSGCLTTEIMKDMVTIKFNTAGSNRRSATDMDSFW